MVIGFILFFALAFDDFVEQCRWQQVTASVRSFSNTSYRCCSRQRCECGGSIQTPLCEHELTAQHAGVCSFRGHCCEYNRSSCSCGSASVGSVVDCWCDDCVAFQTCEVVCASCFNATVTLEFFNPFDHTLSNFTKSSTCDSASGPANWECLGELLMFYGNGTFWFEKDSTSLVRDKSFAVTSKIAVVYALNVVGGAFLVFGWIQMVLLLWFRRCRRPTFMPRHVVDNAEPRTTELPLQTMPSNDPTNV